MYRFTALLLLCLSFSVSARESYLVLGSYPERAVAVQEGQRISFETGLEVLLQEVREETGMRYQLLTSSMEDPADQEMIRYQLGQAGISNPAVLQPGSSPVVETLFSDLSLTDYPAETETAAMGMSLDGQGVKVRYVVAGSFRTPGEAGALQQELEPSEAAIEVRAASVGNATYYRVMIGPFEPGEEYATKESLAKGDVPDAWTYQEYQQILPMARPKRDESLAIGRPLRGLRIPGNPDPMPGSSVQDASGYNPARLRQSGGFPEPGRK